MSGEGASVSGQLSKDLEAEPIGDLNTRQHRGTAVSETSQGPLRTAEQVSEPLVNLSPKSQHRKEGTGGKGPVMLCKHKFNAAAAEAAEAAEPGTPFWTEALGGEREAGASTLQSLGVSRSGHDRVFRQSW